MERFVVSIVREPLRTSAADSEYSFECKELDGFEKSERACMGFVLRGSARVETEIGSVLADPNTIVCVNPGVAWSMAQALPQERCQWLLLEIGDRRWESATASRGRCLDRRAPFDTLLVERSNRAQLLLQCLLEAARHRDSDSLVETLCIELLSHGSTADDASRRECISEEGRRRVDRARHLLAVGFERHLTLEGLAKEVGISKFHLCRTFRRATGCSVIAYLHRIRLCEALNRLREGEDDLLGLALDLGYDSHSHFTRTFRRELGITPSCFRRRIAASPVPSAYPEAPRIHGASMSRDRRANG